MDWRDFSRKAYSSLEPGGFVEIFDFFITHNECEDELKHAGFLSVDITRSQVCPGDTHYDSLYSCLLEVARGVAARTGCLVVARGNETLEL